MMTRGGSERNRSTRKMISQLIGRPLWLRSRASDRPAKRPLATISTASSMVTTTPDRMSGRYFSITLPLKKVSAKRSQPDTSMPLDLADEGAGALLRRRLEDRRRRSLLDDLPVVNEHHTIGS